jgi:2-polyprenyl-6-methoxyphenol hydroxylase-like FAD-dependent oxidoreductase
VTVVDTDVLIVGAGPVGLFLANECARRGLRWRIVETRPTQSEHSKALAIFPRTLEVFDMAGLVDAFLQTANRVTSVAAIKHGRMLAHMQFAPEQSPYPFMAMVPQDVTERLLAEALRHKGGSIEYETTFVSATEQDEGVSAILDRKGQSISLKASFVVACDGAHSTVRHLLNLPFEGAEYEDTFILADLETNETLPANQVQICPHESGPLAIFPMRATRRRIVATVKAAEGETPSLDLVREILAQRAPEDLEARAMHWSSYFRIHHRQVKRLRVGRFFLAGDAAHVHSPFGGQGMNTGIQDVWNLVWKLDLVLRGHGNQELLESYSAERRPVIRKVIEITDTLTRVMGTPSRLAQVLRDAALPVVTRLPPFEHAFVLRLAELDIGYRGSPIVEGAGERYLDESMRGGAGIGSRFLLMCNRDAAISWRESAKRLSESLRDVVELRLWPRRETTLVRPDGYVAYSAHGPNDIAVLQQVRLLLERQTMARPAAA